MFLPNKNRLTMRTTQNTIRAPLVKHDACDPKASPRQKTAGFYRDKPMKPSQPAA